MFDTLIGPFYIMQYLVCAAFIVERITIFAVVMLAFTFLTTTINYILLYISYRKIQDMAEKIIKVRVKRNGSFREIDNHELVPGDIIDPDGEVPCDCLMISGDVFVNEASLTG